MVVSELADSLILWAYIRVCVRSDRMDLQIIPVAVSVRATAAIFDEVVVRTSDPVAGWRLIRVEKGPAPLGHNDAVLLDQVLLLDSILNEDDMTFDIVANVVDQA